MRRSRHLKRLLELDQTLFLRAARTHTPVLDRILPALSRAANYSRIWLGISALLYLFGGRRGKRAAVRGMASVAVNSLIVNTGLKRLVRRPRPQLRRVPTARRLKKQPLTTSFPSGHAASATAFAVGASSEMPKVAVPVDGLAAAVGYSRVYVGVHYPLDVVVGAMCGAAVALGSRLASPVPPKRRDREPYRSGLPPHQSLEREREHFAPRPPVEPLDERALDRRPEGLDGDR
jgi:undecaprenyl-diphosphatase